MEKCKNCPYNLDEYFKKRGSIAGIASAKSRFAGKTKEEISEIMSNVRNKRKQGV